MFILFIFINKTSIKNGFFRVHSYVEFINSCCFLFCYILVTQSNTYCIFVLVFGIFCSHFYQIK